MFSGIKRAWQRYLDSLPRREEEPPPVSDAAILREMNPALPPEQQAAFAQLVALLTAHLPPEVADKHRSSLQARLRRGGTAVQALGKWVAANHGPKARNLGLLCVDWKAREEIAWQADRIAKCHGLALAWACDWQADTTWEAECQRRGDQPVSAPLRSLAQALRAQGRVLLVFDDDDNVCACTVALADEAAARGWCAQLTITLAPEA